MITNTHSVLACVAATALLGDSIGFAAEGMKIEPAQPVKIHLSLDLAQSRVVMTGSTVVIELDASAWAAIQVRAKQWDLPATLQWRLNNQPIPNTKGNTLVLDKVDFSDAGSYSAVVSGAAEVQTIPLHLSVYSLYETNSNGGTMSVPVGDFIKGSSAICGGTFDRYKVYFPFYGPNCQNETGPFVNTSEGSNLTVSTCFTENGGVDTAVQIKENWVPMNQVGCSDNTICAGQTKLSSCTVNGLQSGKTYRVGIFFKSSTLGGRTYVLFNWLYF